MLARVERLFSHLRGSLFSLRVDSQRDLAVCQGTFGFLNALSCPVVSTCLDVNTCSDLVLLLGGLGLNKTAQRVGSWRQGTEKE